MFRKPMILLVFFTVSISPVYSQELKPVGEEAYQLLLQFYEYDRDIPLDAQVVEVQNTDTYVREKIVFTGVHNCRVPGYLAVPKNGNPPYPCVFTLHGLTDSKEGWWQDDGWLWGGRLSKRLLAMGYAVLALDAEYHGERIADNDFVSVNEMVYHKAWYNRFCKSVVQTTVDYRRALDYLETRQDIDASRIGVIGASMGGMTTFLLTAVEPRITTSISTVTWMIDTEDIIIKKGHKADFIAPHNVAHAINGRPFLMMMGRDDKLYTIDQGNRLFDLIDSKEKNIIWYDSGHRLPVEYVDKAAAWFKEHL
ncbi:MAG: acetylxylan esterase [Candidatus Latescibacteria bacterium]|nr:acetylxylan esterase [Candidatus Latescibacterota bacterium]